MIPDSRISENSPLATFPRSSPIRRPSPSPCRPGRIFSFLSIWLHAPSSIRMLAYKCLLWWGRKRYVVEPGFTQRLPFNLYAKYGPNVRLAEAMATKYVEENTSIPVPSIVDVLRDSGGVFILMTRLPGVPFGENYLLGELTSEELSSFEETLRDWFSQLRSLPAPSGAIASIDGSPCRSYRVNHQKDFGPFLSESDFTAYLFETVPARYHDQIRDKIERLSPGPHRLCFSHGDIHPNNFLFHNGHLSGMIDWECSGWYPESWDYTYAMYNRAVYKEWCEMFSRIFPQYGKELEIEQAFWAVHNPW